MANSYLSGLMYNQNAMAKTMANAMIDTFNNVASEFKLVNYLDDAGFNALADETIEIIKLARSEKG